MTKYIVKGCPAFGITANNACALTSDDSCSFTDCRIKQIVELCKAAVSHSEWCNCPELAEAVLAKEILQILDVQEVE